MEEETGLKRLGLQSKDEIYLINVDAADFHFTMIVYDGKISAYEHNLDEMKRHEDRNMNMANAIQKNKSMAIAIQNFEAWMIWQTAHPTMTGTPLLVLNAESQFEQALQQEDFTFENIGVAGARPGSNEEIYRLKMVAARIIGLATNQFFGLGVTASRLSAATDMLNGTEKNFYIHPIVGKRIEMLTGPILPIVHVMLTAAQIDTIQRRFEAAICSKDEYTYALFYPRYGHILRDYIALTPISPATNHFHEWCTRPANRRYGYRDFPIMMSPEYQRLVRQPQTKLYRVPTYKGMGPVFTKHPDWQYIEFPPDTPVTGFLAYYGPDYRMKEPARTICKSCHQFFDFQVCDHDENRIKEFCSTCFGTRNRGALN